MDIFRGYNGIAIADSGNQIIVSAEVIGSGPESGCFPEMLDSLDENMKTVTGEKDALKNSLLEGGTGFFSETNLQEAKKRKIEVLIPDPQFRRWDPYFADRKGHEVEKKKYTKYTIKEFNYDKENNCYGCQAGKELVYKGYVKLRNNSGEKYQATRWLYISKKICSKKYIDKLEKEIQFFKSMIANITILLELEKIIIFIFRRRIDK